MNKLYFIEKTAFSLHVKIRSTFKNFAYNIWKFIQNLDQKKETTKNEKYCSINCTDNNGTFIISFCCLLMDIFRNHHRESNRKNVVDTRKCYSDK